MVRKQELLDDVLNTVNIDIGVCIHFRDFTKIGNFTWA